MTPLLPDSHASPLARRHFLRGSVVTATALSYTKIAARAAGLEASDTLRVGLVGCGQQGLVALASSTVKIPDVKFAAICDIWGFKRASAKKQIGISGLAEYENIDDMLTSSKELDCVLLATPDHLHAPDTRKSLEAGKHVYCEKMMSNTIEGAADMVRAQRHTGKLLQIGHQRRSNPRYILMRDELIRKQNLVGQITHLYGQWNRSYKPPLLPKLDAKSFEKIKAAGYSNILEYGNWRWFKKFGGGPISDLGAHQIDVFNWLLGATPKAVIASGGRDYFQYQKLPDGTPLGYEHLDNAIVTYEYDVPGHGLVRATYQVLTTNGSQNYYEKVMGLEGTIVISEVVKQGNDVYREKDTTGDKIGDWERLATEGLLSKAAGTVYNKFWERPKAWGSPPDRWLDNGGAAVDARVSVGADPYEIPALPPHLAQKSAHQHHLENFFNTVRRGGKQTDLNCPVEDAYKCCRSVLAINDAVREGRRIEFKPEDFIVT